MASKGTQRILQLYFHQMCFPHNIEVKSLVSDDFVLQGMEDDEWVDAYKIVITFNKSHKTVNLEHQRQILRLAADFFFHKNILVLLEYKDPSKGA